MRFENNVLHLKSSVSGANDRTGLAKSSAVLLGVAGKTGLQQKRLVPDACPHVVTAALSRLLAQVLGGFSGYREAMNSVLFTRVADYGETTPASTPPPSGVPRAHRNSTSLDRRAHRAPNRPRSAVLRGWSGAIASSIVAWRRRLRRERDIRSAIAALESLDDWMLRDIGIHRCQIEHVVRYGDDASGRSTPTNPAIRRFRPG
jgi:uncharacterized protein YjiS (DUF1127 family)